ncbi:MAG: aminotransferase class III-fold pyridoxal phosphate-dependent enzyme [Acidimicrobiia bacterium]|nr:aminotransferase class III-fold pyridoxal phosphate-dependent enzyme [Acidimicrobiia bacterium]
MPDAEPRHVSPLLKRATAVHAARGEGVYIIDSEGRRYLDFTAGIGVTSTGHCHPTVVNAIRNQAETLIHGQYTTVLHPLLEELSCRLAQVLPGEIDNLFYASAGTEAVEASVRLARNATGKSNLIVFHGGFHGRTTAWLSMTTSKTGYGDGLQPLMAGVFVAPFPYSYRYGWEEEETVEFCLRELDFLLATQTAPNETAAMVVEPVLGEGGFVPAPDTFLQGLRARCDRHGILLIIDEVQAGFGRTGDFWGHDPSRVTPDVVIAAKGLASGMPLAAMAASRDLMGKGWPGSQGGTYGGNAVACAAALATLDVIEKEQLVENAAAVGARLVEQLRDVASRHEAIGDVRGRGLMIGAEFSHGDGTPDGDTATEVRRQCERRGLLLLPCGAFGQVVRWLPPLIVSEAKVKEAVEIFEGAVAEATG